MFKLYIRKIKDHFFVRVILPIGTANMPLLIAFSHLWGRYIEFKMALWDRLVWEWSMFTNGNRTPLWMKPSITFFFHDLCYPFSWLFTQAVCVNNWILTGKFAKDVSIPKAVERIVLLNSFIHVYSLALVAIKEHEKTHNVKLTAWEKYDMHEKANEIRNEVLKDKVSLEHDIHMSHFKKRIR